MIVFVGLRLSLWLMERQVIVLEDLIEVFGKELSQVMEDADLASYSSKTWLRESRQIPNTAHSITSKREMEEKAEK